MRMHTLLIVAVALSLAACSQQEDHEQAAVLPQEVVLTIEGMKITGPTEFPSGWVTLKVVNNSAMTHFILFEKMPDGKGAWDHLEVATIFQNGTNRLLAGDEDGAMEVFGSLPEWWQTVQFLGGPGLVGPGETSYTTLQLDSGHYVGECYVKSDGVFHSYSSDPNALGMVHEFAVVPGDNAAEEPVATISLSLSRTEGITGAHNVSAGRHTVGVTFKDQEAHEHFMGQDVHLVRLDDTTDVEALTSWMNWSVPGGLQTPAPAHFLGGTSELPAGRTAYFTVNLSPGEYAFISEVPSPQDKGMFQRFTVEEEGH